MNTIRLLYVFFRVSVLNETAYRLNFFLQLFQSLLELGTALAGLAVIFSFTNTLGGWGVDEMLALVGVYFLIGAIISLIIQPGMSALIDSVRDGTLDFTLTKPEDFQLLVSIQRVAIFSLVDLLLGLGVLDYRAGPAGREDRRLAGGGLYGDVAGRWNYCLQFLVDPGKPVILVRAGGEPARDLPQHVRSRALAGEPVSGLVTLRPDLHRSGGFCHHHPGRGADRQAKWMDPGGGSRAGGAALHYCSAGVEARAEALLGGFGLSMDIGVQRIVNAGMGRNGKTAHL